MKRSFADCEASSSAKRLRDFNTFSSPFITPSEQQHSLFFEQSTAFPLAPPLAPESSNHKRLATGEVIDFSHMKRLRTVDQQKESELAPILSRIITWLQQAHQKGCLPRTVSRLSHAITPMCRAVVEVDAKVVFYHLLFNRVLLIEELHGQVVFRANPEPLPNLLGTAGSGGRFMGILPDDANPSIPFSDDFVTALEKSATWVLSNRGLNQYKSAEGIMHSLAQLCRFKREAASGVIIDALLRKGIISFVEPPASSRSYHHHPTDLQVTYALPAEASMSGLPCHYMSLQIEESMTEQYSAVPVL